MSDSSNNIEFYVKNIEKFEQSGDKVRVSIDIIYLTDESSTHPAISKNSDIFLGFAKIIPIDFKTGKGRIITKDLVFG